MWADAQRDGRPAQYIRCRLRKFRNSIPCTTVQTLANARCSSAVQNARTVRKVNFAAGKVPLGDESPKNQSTSTGNDKHRAKFGWLPLRDVSAATKPRRETR